MTEMTVAQKRHPFPIPPDYVLDQHNDGCKWSGWSNLWCCVPQCSDLVERQRDSEVIQLRATKATGQAVPS